MAADTFQQSFWYAAAAPAPHIASSAGKAKADVAIVGGRLSRLVERVAPCRALGAGHPDRGARDRLWRVRTQHRLRRAQLRRRWRLEVPAGPVTADMVLLTTNAMTGALLPRVARSLVPLVVHQIATQPLHAANRRSILPENHCASDTRRNIFAYRWTPDGRLVTGEAAAIAAGGPGRLAQSFLARLKRLLPITGPLTADFSWSGAIALTRDVLPRVFKVDNGLFAAIGCNGRGLALSTALGSELAEFLTSDAHALSVPISRPAPIRARRIAKHLPSVLLPWARLRGSTEPKIGAPPAAPADRKKVPMTKLTEDAKGVYVISATPFLTDGALDLEGTGQLIDFYLGCGVDGITILGVMGEATKMTETEATQFVERVLRCVDGRVPVIVGVTHTALTVVKSLVHASMDLGAAGVMLQPIAGLKGDDAIYNYFALVFETIGADVPVVYQDFPQASGVHLSPAVWNRMVDAFPQLVMLKHEDWPGLAKLTRIREDERNDGRRRVSILVGNNGLFLPQELRRGADGAMTGFAYPDVLVEVCKRFFAGEEDAAEDLFDHYVPLNRHEQQPGFGLAVRKEILRRRGAVRTATARQPAYRLTSTDMAEIDGLLARAERAR